MYMSIYIYTYAETEREIYIHTQYHAPTTPQGGTVPHPTPPPHHTKEGETVTHPPRHRGGGGLERWTVFVYL